ncbi:MAG TPA: hypothetical protein PKK15_13615 [Kouleothrix sp.]|uniref:hypothetical protein n=1 Tax=Kouleothrix sp. TaxID=2779161 RepID=UPI002B80A1EE|nr:hypothetical protein [Kouleothrix sp.]
MSATQAYQGIRYDDPRVQAEFEQLLGRVVAAEQARTPIAQRHRKAERDAEEGAISDAQFRAIDTAYIAANNAIAAAQRAVDQFLHANRNYRTS